MYESAKQGVVVMLAAALLGTVVVAKWAGADPLPVPAQSSPAIDGLTVRVGGKPIGRFIGYIDGLALVDLADTASESGTVLVGQAATLGNAPLLEVMSPTGYMFRISTGSLELPGLNEGELQRAPVIFYDSPNCGGQPYLVLQNAGGRFGTTQLGDGRLRSLNRWVARQGMVIRSSDPADATAVYMVRRGTDVEEVFLRSLKVFAPAMTPPGAVCFSPPFAPAYDLAVRLEPLDPAEAGVAGPLGGGITVGL